MSTSYVLQPEERIGVLHKSSSFLYMLLGYYSLLHIIHKPPRKF
jgi:hypothetical protein